MMRMAWLALAGMMVAACGADVETSADSPSSAPTPADRAVVLEEVVGSPREQVPSALDDPNDAALPAPQIDTARIRSGGPPPDGIPSIDQPLFEQALQVGWLDEDEAVIALSMAGQERAYPVQVMVWHEIVNDTVGGEHVAITYCPLCNSALAFDREVGGRVLTFGTSGSLYLSSLVMYDRQTESLWSQVDRAALAGVQSGEKLELLPVSMIRWGDWLDANPDGWVLSRETGFSRDYGRNPYVGYDAVDNGSTLLDEAVDGRLPAKERVVTFPEAASPIAVLLSDLAEVRVAEIDLDGAPVVLLAEPGLASSLDSEDISQGREIAATGAFRPELDGQRLTFVRIDGDDGAVARDEETGSTWDLLGRAVSGPLEGSRLESVPHLDTFWFAQAAFEPATQILALEG